MSTWKVETFKSHIWSVIQLEYTIDLTKEGYQQQNQGGGHDYYGGQSYSSPYGKTRNYGYRHYTVLMNIRLQLISIRVHVYHFGKANIPIFTYFKICIGLLVLEDQAEKIILTEYLWGFFQIWAENRIHLQWFVHSGIRSFTCLCGVQDLCCSTNWLCHKRWI